ncbi:hypothetical protein LCGC14_0684420 [marine sediment metagenome]|uniref:Uncharacterized protein n=1 Tax=marine sediment metagenome TaxID=412755 RepID=A0A0F9QS81_9ZZZZ
MDNITDTGLRFKGHPVLLGPSPISGGKADKMTLTRLDRFLRKHFPFLLDFGEQRETLVNGATSLKSKEGGD